MAPPKAAEPPSAQVPTQRVLPFAARVKELYAGEVAHAFILHGEVYDYTLPRVELHNYLRGFLARWDTVCYSRNRGIYFLRPDDEKNFRKRIKEARKAKAVAGQQDEFAPDAGEMELPSEPGDALMLLEEFMNTGTAQTAVIIDNPHSFAPAADWATMAPPDRVNVLRLASWGRDMALGGKGVMIFLLLENINDLHPDVKSARYEPIRLSLPDTTSRARFIEWFETKQKDDDQAPIIWGDGFDDRKLAVGTGGLGLMALDDIMLRSRQTPCTPALVKDRKGIVYKTKYGDVLSPVEPRGGYEGLGGYEYIKRFFREYVIDPVRRGEFSEVPMGILLMGPPGTGKSAFMEATAFECGFQMMDLKLGGQIASKWQGEGERNLMRALDGLLSLAPVIARIDEIDQAMARGGGTGSNQQENRIFQMMMEFLSDSTRRGKVIILAATNRPDLLDAALKRPGRFDTKCIFFVPNDGERKAIFDVYLRKKELQIPVETWPIDETINWTGAEIELLCNKAARLAKQGIPVNDSLNEALQRIRPTTQDKEAMTAAALAEVNDKDLLPPEWQKAWSKGATKEAVSETFKDQIERGTRRDRSDAF